MVFDAEKNIFKTNPKVSLTDKIEVEIGDSKQPDFKPQFKVMRWDNEVNFSMRAVADEGTIIEKDGKVEYKTKDFDIHQYEVEIGEDGGFEFEWVLSKKPTSNVFTATIQTKELDFLYQPPLSPEEIAQGSVRPDNVIGSYAVYHKSKRDNIVGGNEYKTGKFCHIYRPEAIDANGNKIWCDLHIDTQAGLLTVTVPQIWLDNAVYPVKVDPTFGYTSAGATALQDTSNTIYCSNVNNSSISGEVSSVSVYAKANPNTSSNNFRAIIYKASDNTRRGDVSVTKNINTTLQWWDVSWVGRPLLSSSDTYYPSIHHDGVTASFFFEIYYDSGTSGDSKSMVDSFADGSPNTVTLTNSSNIYSIYATYTEFSPPQAPVSAPWLRA